MSDKEWDGMRVRARGSLPKDFENYCNDFEREQGFRPSQFCIWAYREKEIEQLRARLKIAEEALGFYAEKKSWHDQDLLGCRTGIDGTDDEDVDGNTIGGKRAREAIKAIRGEE